MTADSRSDGPVFEQPAANVTGLTPSWLTQSRSADAPPRVVPDPTPVVEATTPDVDETEAPPARTRRQKPRPSDKPASPEPKPPIHGRKTTNFDLPESIAQWVKTEAADRRVGMGDVLIEALEEYDSDIAARIERRPTIGGKRFAARTVRATTPDWANEPKRTVTMRFGLDDWATLVDIEREMNAESLVHLVRTALAVCMEHRTTKGDAR